MWTIISVTKKRLKVQRREKKTVSNQPAVEKTEKV